MGLVFTGACIYRGLYLQGLVFIGACVHLGMYTETSVLIGSLVAAFSGCLSTKHQQPWRKYLIVGHRLLVAIEISYLGYAL